MWQEARKHEKIIRGIMVDYRRRAERRRGFYEKIKKDPAQFLQVWGQKAKIHIDPNIASAADNTSIMTKWRGDEEVVIDRFDARSHLDILPEYNETNEENLTEAQKNEERMLNFERYRTLVQNEALGISETQCLKQIEIDEKFGDQSEKTEKKSKEPKAQIGFSYKETSYVEKTKSPSISYSNKPNFAQAKLGTLSSDEDSDNDLDLVLNVINLTSDEKVILNKKATDFGMAFGDYVRMLILDNEEKESLKRNKEIELEKSQYSGRKSRRERRLAKEKRLREKGSLSPLSFIVHENKDATNENKSNESRSRSSSSSNSNYREKSKRSESPSNSKLCFITSFGEEAEEHSTEDINSFLKEMNKSKSSKIDATKASLRRLKENLTRSLSRSRSRSPVVKEKKTFIDLDKKKLKIKNSMEKSTPSSSDSSSDEDKALEKYLKRRESRKFEIEKSDKTNPRKEDLNKPIKPGESSSKNNLSGDFKFIQEKLKKKMKKEIDKQIKKDRKQEKEKRKKEKEERREREAKLEYLSEKIKGLRKKEGKEITSSSTSDSDSSRSSRSRSRSLDRSKTRYRRRSSSYSSSSDGSKNRHRYSKSPVRYYSTSKRSRSNRSRSSSRSSTPRRSKSPYYKRNLKSRSRSRS